LPLSWANPHGGVPPRMPLGSQPIARTLPDRGVFMRGNGRIHPRGFLTLAEFRTSRGLVPPMPVTVGSDKGWGREYDPLKEIAQSQGLA
jgi:hypothetical protein